MSSLPPPPRGHRDHSQHNPPPNSASLQIPTIDSPAGPSRSTTQSAAHPSRPVSASVHQSTTPASPIPQPSASSSSRRQQRASHTVVSPTNNPQPSQNNSQSLSQDDQATLYQDVYSHPAAVAYAAAHPRRTIPKFGPYLLLQTLGEGEFGKVKLGLHGQWGEEVAVKLIRRGNVDSSVRMSKVEREIEVLRTLKHPNIVRLYDVIETDKYIGIILEYASGGELFDHILAHRYLRERDAAKLFSQLISGVWYIHQKKIVHRDLKLENLLLDRHRNVIITDFGFANRFEHRADDLMQTSCGSPCYAAPELVISEGLYVGSAVDIWSCGVILYAMLAGYLPFDDDPANPDGDNINLLYKYIVNTPLSFPEYISPEARDLLGMMLVPDPTRRSSLEGVMRHPWLSLYALPPRADGVPTAFGRTVEDLERAAMEQHNQKRLAYQKQMKAAATAAGKDASVMPRSQSHRPEAQSSAAAAGNRSRSTQPEYLYDSSADQSTMVSPGAQTTPTNKENGRAKIGSPAALGLSDDDPFAAPASSSSANIGNVVVTTSTTTTTSRGRPSDDNTNLSPAQSPSKGHKSSGSGGGGFRHTIQVEYDDPKTSGSGRRSNERSQRERTGSQGQSQVSGQQNGYIQPSSTPTKERRPSQSSGSSKPLPPSPNIPAPSSYRAPLNSGSVPNTPKVVPPTPSQNTPNKTPTRPSDTATPTDATPQAYASVTDKDKDANSQTSTSSIKKGHKKGKSSIDRLAGLGKIFGVGAGSSSGPLSAPAVASSEATGSSRVPSDSSSNGMNAPQPPVNGENREGRKSRRNTLTVMVEPFSRSIRNRSGKAQGRMASTPVTADGASGASIASVTSKKSDMQPQSHPAKPVPTAPVTSAGFTNADLEVPGVAGMQASTGKAKKVMQWFRSKSKGSEVPGLSEVEDDGGKEKDPQQQQQNYRKGYAASSSTLNQQQQNVVSPVQVVVTTPTSATGRAVQMPGTPAQPHRTPSSTTESSFVTPSLVTRFRNSVTVGGLNSSSAKHHHQQQAQQHPHGQLRIHHGAVDQTTITTRAPPEVMKHVKEVLEGMGVEIQLESEYKYRCIRAKKRKQGGGGSTMPGGGASVGPGGIAAVSVAGSAASNGVDKRGLPLPSPSSFSGTGNMLRGLLMRRQSSQVSNSGMGRSSEPSLAFDDETSVVVSEPLMSTDTAYGDPSQDAGDEVRFSVELTRLDRLNDTYSLDIRRLKGNLRSYKFLYDTLRQRADLQR